MSDSLSQEIDELRRSLRRTQRTLWVLVAVVIANIVWTNLSLIWNLLAVVALVVIGYAVYRSVRKPREKKTGGRSTSIPVQE